MRGRNALPRAIPVELRPKARCFISALIRHCIVSFLSQRQVRHIAEPVGK